CVRDGYYVDYAMDYW
nr:immunoglobulin heavy chain junction region [Mus musculus]